MSAEQLSEREMWWRQHHEDVTSFIARRIVQLVWTDAASNLVNENIDDWAEQYDVQTRYVTGFLAQSEYFAAIVTAGHCVKVMKQVTVGERYFVKGRIFDRFGQPGRHSKGIAFDENVLPSFELYEDVEGLDYGILPLRLYFRNLLGIDETDCHRDNVFRVGHHEEPTLDDFDYIVLSGFPEEKWSADVLSTGDYRPVSINSGLLTMRVELLAGDDFRVPDCLKKNRDRIYASVTDIKNVSPAINSVVGMSGGPLVGIKRVEDGFEATLIGIQSTWAPNSKVIAVCPIHRLFYELDNMAEEKLVHDAEESS